MQHVLDISPLKYVLFPERKQLISVQSVTSAVYEGLIALTGHMRAWGSQLRLSHGGSGRCQLDSKGKWHSYIHPTESKKWCFMLCKPLNACVPGAWMMRNNVNCIDLKFDTSLSAYSLSSLGSRQSSWKCSVQMSCFYEGYNQFPASWAFVLRNVNVEIIRSSTAGVCCWTTSHVFRSAWPNQIMLFI